MSYQQDSIDWQAIANIDRWLDSAVADEYKGQPLAQDWARLSKIGEEYGEAVNAFIGLTGQNPRKGVYATAANVHNELADVVFTAILCMQHLIGDTQSVKDILRSRLAAIEKRIP